MSKILQFLKTVVTIAFAITSVAFTFIPDDMFEKGIIPSTLSAEQVIVVNKVLFFLSIAIVVLIGYLLYRTIRCSVSISGNNYSIRIEYGDIFKMPKATKVIGFDECFTTAVGQAPHEIKTSSVCGQFLTKFNDVDFNAVVQSSGLAPQRKRSNYQNKVSYESGRTVRYEDFLIMAFAKLDKDGRGELTRKEYLSALDILWDELDKHSRLHDVAIPVLGAGITRFKDGTLTNQQLVDMIIASYKLSPNKLKKPAVLHIVCRKEDEFSLNKIGEYI